MSISSFGGFSRLVIRQTFCVKDLNKAKFCVVIWSLGNSHTWSNKGLIHIQLEILFAICIIFAISILFAICILFAISKLFAMSTIRYKPVVLNRGYAYPKGYARHSLGVREK